MQQISYKAYSSFLMTYKPKLRLMTKLLQYQISVFIFSRKKKNYQVQ